MNTLAERYLLCKSQMKALRCCWVSYLLPLLLRLHIIMAPDWSPLNYRDFSKGSGTLEGLAQMRYTVMFFWDENNYPEQVRRITHPALLSRDVWLLVCWKHLFPVTKELLLTHVFLKSCSLYIVVIKPDLFAKHSFCICPMTHSGQKGTIPKLWSVHLCQAWGSRVQQRSP